MATARLLLVATLLACSSAALADLDVLMTGSDMDIVAGDTFALTITVSNSGPGTVTDVDARVFFLIDDGVNTTFADFVSSSPATCSVNTAGPQGFISCPVASLGAGSDSVFTVNMQSTTDSTFFLLPSAFLVDDGNFVPNVRSDLQVDVARNFTTDSDADGVADLAETLLGFDPNNPFLTPSGPTVDLLVYHTPGAAALYGGDPTTRINHLVTVANQINTSSGTGVTFNVSAITSIAASDTDTNPQALTKMLARTGVFSTLNSDRDTAAADVVVLMRPLITGSGNCGFASVLGVDREGDIDFSGANANALGTVSIDCRDRTTAHEIGHIMGLGHDRRDVASTGTFNYSRGYGVDNEFVTVMGVASEYGVFANDEVNLFSSPDLSCGVMLPCGVDRTDPTNGADAAFSLIRVGHLASTFRFRDTDSDGVPDDQDAFAMDAGEQFDIDGDGMGNNADTDDDGDQIADATEIGAGLNPFNPADATQDPDGDGFNNRDELAFGTAINDAGSSPGGQSIVLRIVSATAGAP